VDAVSELKRQPRFSSVEPLLAKARAVAIFPRLLKVSLLFGGEGGNGVVLVKRADGSWNGPAFYSLAAPSVGLQVGVRATTVMLFIMNDLTVERMLQSSLTLGASTSATLGQVGERDLTETELLTKDILELAESGGAFAGVSYEGYLITARQKHNEAYYGSGANPRGILLDTTYARSEADVLRNAL
jgi:lipid-binding SYLF domain-containing protein